MQKSSLNYRTAFFLALAISLLMNILFLIMFFYGRNAVLPSDEESIRPTFHFSNALMNLSNNFTVAFLLYLLNFWLLKSRLFSRRAEWLFVVLVIFICVPILSYSCSSIQVRFMDFGQHAERFIRGGIFRDYIIAIVVILSSGLLHLSTKQQKIALENEALQAENMKSRFMALKNQVDPHFLFNSLNTLNSLIKTDADKAQEYVQQLSFVFRYTLQNKEVITLEEELKFTQAYCHLMKIRYGENLQFTHHINEGYHAYYVIPLSLQTLVENAIKHNVVSNRLPLPITFFTSTNETITVSNPIQPKKELETGESIGLSNLSERYRLMWNKEITVRNSDGLFEVEIPLIP